MTGSLQVEQQTATAPRHFIERHQFWRHFP